MRWKSCVTLRAVALLALRKTMLRGSMAAATTTAMGLALSLCSVVQGQDVLHLTTPGAGSVTIPAGYEWTNVTIQCWGGGGGGGYSYDGGGGGGGGYAFTTYATLLSGSHNYYIGAGGDAGNWLIMGGLSGEDTIWNYQGVQDVWAGGGTGGGLGAGGILHKGFGYQGGNGGVRNYNGGGGGGSAGPSGSGGNGGNASYYVGGYGGTGFGDGGYGAGQNLNFPAAAGSFPGGGGGGGSGFAANPNGAQGANGEIIITYTLEAVPEPSTLALLGIGVTALFGWAWRRWRLSRT